MDNRYVDKKINDALSSIDDISKASPGPFFFTRLEARMMNDKNIWSNLSMFFARPAVAFACISIVIFMNIAVLFSTGNAEFGVPQSASEVALADEYSDFTATLYEFER